MNISINKTFATRDELDSYVKSRFGDDSSKNADIVMQMSGEEMQKLALDESTTVHGVKVEATVIEGGSKKAPVLGRGVIVKKKKGKKKLSK